MARRPRQQPLMSANMRRLHLFADRLRAFGLKFPESKRRPGHPHYSQLCRDLSIHRSNLESTNGGRHNARSALVDLLHDLAGRIGLMPLDAYLNAMAAAGLQALPDDIGSPESAVAAWEKQLAAAGRKVPRSAFSHTNPDYAAIAIELGVAQGTIRSKQSRYRTLIDAVAERVGFADVGARPEGQSGASASTQSTRMLELFRTQRAARVAAIKLYLSEKKRSDSFIPESPLQKGVPLYSAIYRSANLPPLGVRLAPGNELRQQHQVELERLIDETAKEIGVGPGYVPFRGMTSGQAISYVEAEDIGLRRLTIEMNEPSQSVINRFRSALAKVRKHYERHETDAVGPELTFEISATIEQIGRTYSNEDTRRHWVNDITRWHHFLKPSSFRGSELPTTFAGAINVLYHRSGYASVSALARATTIPRKVVETWMKGLREPFGPDYSGVHSMEDALGAPRGTLTSRLSNIYIRSGQLRTAQFPDGFGNSTRLRRLVYAVLPADFTSRPNAERERVIKSLIDDYETRIGFRIRMRNVETWRLNPLPEALSEEFTDLESHKTERLPPDDLIRAQIWRLPTADVHRNAFHTFFSALSLPTEKGGLGIEPNKLTFGLIISVPFILWYARFLAIRADGVLHTGVRTFFGIVCALLRPKTGYVWQRHDLAARVEPVGRRLALDIVNEAQQSKEGWRRVCEETHRRIYEALKSHEDEYEFARDSFEPIMPILETARPLDALHDALDQAYARLPDPAVATSFERAIALRNHLGVRFTVRTNLRSKNISNLTYSEDGSGELRKTEDRWHLQIIAEKFKNSNGPFFGRRRGGGRKQRSGQPYVFTFPAEDTALIDEYVLTCRPFLLDEKQHDGLWVTKTGGKVGPNWLSAQFSDFTWAYLVYHEVTKTGIPNVEIFGPHAVRHIAATHILKQTGDVNLAADALQDSPVTIEMNYARFLPSDRSARVASFQENDAKLRRRVA